MAEPLADQQIQQVTNIVRDKLGAVSTWASQARQAALQAIVGIGTFETPVVTTTLPDAPTLMTPEDPAAGSPPDATVTVNPIAVEYAETDQVEFNEPDTLPDPVYGTAQKLRARPSYTPPTPPTNYVTVDVPTIPGRPDLYDPSAPTLTGPAPVTLIEIKVPTFDFPTIEPFSLDIPQYDAPVAPPPPGLQLAEYDPAALQARVKSLLTGYTPDMELLRTTLADIMVAEADREATKAINTAFDAAAAQNWALPPGMLVEAVDTIHTENGRKIRAGMSKINNDLAKTALENYRVGVAEALALEKHLIDLHLEHARQLLETERFRVKSQVELFNATVALFNAQQGARAQHMAAYKAELQTTLAMAGAYPTMVEGALAEIAENDQRVQMYGADAKLVAGQTEVYKNTAQKITAEIETYRAEIGGIKTQSDTILANIESYRSAVAAYAAGVEATALNIQAFATETQSKTSEVSVLETNAKAYAAYIQESAKRAQVYRAFAAAQGDVLRANLQTFQTAAETNQSFVRAHAAKVAAEAEIAQARSSAYSTGVRATTSYNHALVQNNSAQQQYALTAAENAARAAALAATAQAETDRVNAGAIAAKAQAVAGLAQGSMSALHVSAAAEGSGSISSSASFQSGVDSTWGGNTTYAESKIERLSA